MKGFNLLLYLSMICISCNYFDSKEIKKRIKEGTVEANDSLKQNYINERTSLKEIYNDISAKIKDTAMNRKINTYYFELNGVIAHMDSLKKNIDTVDISGIKDNKAEGIFVNDYTKYDLFEKIRQLYVLSSGIAKTDERKLEVSNSKKNLLFSSDNRQLADFYFGQNDAQQGTWILYGFESEIIKIGIDCFKDYNE